MDADSTDYGQRRLWRPRLRLERHVLVFSRRGRSLRLLFVLHRTDVLAYS